MPENVRIDKYLWAARFFKTRALASKACELGRILSNEITAKASRDVKIGDTLTIKNEAGTFIIEVLALTHVRGPSATAQTLFRETEASKAERERVNAERKAMLANDPTPTTRPTKRDRRLIHRFNDR